MKLVRYEIWDANVKFEDSNDVKQRPVLIWNNTAFVAAYKMTGTDRGNNKDEYRVEYWKEAGLDKPTAIRIVKPLKLNENDLVKKRGNLDPRDILKFEFRLAM